MAWCRSREAEADVPAMANMSPTSLSDVHDSPRGRFMNAFGLGLPKSMAREEDAEHEQIPCMSRAYLFSHSCKAVGTYADPQPLYP